MKGLLLKDLAIVKQQGRSIFIIVAIAIFMMLAGNDITFVIAYANILFVMFGITTLNYDAFDNGFAFLFTLPISRKMYVLEKYVFSALCVASGLVLSTVLMVATGNFTSETAGFILGYALAAVLLLSILLPVELKYGPEKGRIAMLVIFAVIFALVFGLKKVAINVDLTKIVATLNEMNKAMTIGVIGIFAIVMLGISILVSCRIIEKKEFKKEDSMSPLFNIEEIPNPLYIKNSLRSIDAQLTDRNLLLCSPLARGVCVKTHTFLFPFI